MKNVKIAFAAVGGCSLVGLLVVGWLLFSAMGARTEAREGHDAKCSVRARLAGSKIPLTDASLKQLESNADNYADWIAAARDRAARGDRAASTNLTAAAFKQRLVDEAFELRKLPGAGAALVKDDFAFGFSDYIAGGKIPDAAKLQSLERQWIDICLLTHLLSDCGAVELTDVTVVEKKEDPKAAKPTGKKPAAKTAKKDAKTKKGAKQAEAAPEPEVTSQSYELRFKAGPAALVKALNALALDDRFIVVDGFSFARPVDQVAQVLGGDAKKEAGENASSSKRGRGRGRGRKAAEEPEETEGQAQHGYAVDAEREAPFDVTLKLTTYDFGRGVSDSEPETENKNAEPGTPNAEPGTPNP